MGQPRAGLIPYVIEDNQIQMLFMRPSDPRFGTDALQIAKGKIDKGETPEHAAIREAQEELGLFKSNIDNVQLLGTFLKSITVYICHVKDKTLFGQPNFETESTEWLTIEQFYEQGRDLHRMIVEEAYQVIREQNG